MEQLCTLFSMYKKAASESDWKNDITVLLYKEKSTKKNCKN